MPRQIRYNFPGIPQHVIQCGNNSGGDYDVRGDSYCPRRRGLDYADLHTFEQLGMATQAGQVNMLLISLVY